MTIRILLSATGLSPQVVTETFFALATAPKADRVVVDEVHIVTTARGADRARLQLMDARGNAMDRLCRQYRIKLPQVLLHIMAGESGPIHDLRTAAENDVAANSILEVVRGLTARSDTEIHFSIAGGRKTMGYYLGTCASLLARPQDRMSHVLVNEPFESSPEFFFPPQPPAILQLRSGPSDTADARIDLAPVGFIRLRSLLPEPLIRAGSFTTIVAVVDGMLTGPSVCLQVAAPLRDGAPYPTALKVSGGLEIQLPPKSFALYWLLAQQAARGRPWVDALCAADVVRRDYLRVYRLASGASQRYVDEEKTLTTTDGQFRKRDFDNALARLCKELKQALGDHAAQLYGPQSTGVRGQLRHGLTLLPSSITFEAPGRLL